MNFLTGLGSLAYGIPQGIQWSQALQQTQGQSALGDALAQMGGGQKSQGLGGVIQNLFGGQSNQPQTAQLPQIPEQQPIPSPQNAPTSNMPMVLPGAQSNVAPIPSAQPAIAPQPMVANAAGPPWMQTQPSAGPQPSAQPSQQPAQAPSPIDASQYSMRDSMQQPQRRQEQQIPMGQGALDLPTLVHLIRQARPGIQGSAMTAAVTAAMPLLHEQGLAQYRGLENQLRGERLDLQEERLAQQAQQFGQSQAEKRREFDTRQGNIKDRFNRSLSEKEKQAGNSSDERARLAKYKESAQAIVFSRDMKDDEKSRRLDELDQKYDQERAGGGHAGTEDDPVEVQAPQDATRLKPGTVYKTPDGQLMVR